MCISLSTEVYITFADLFLDQSKSCIHSWFTILMVIIGYNNIVSGELQKKVTVTVERL